MPPDISPHTSAYYFSLATRELPVSAENSEERMLNYRYQYCSLATRATSLGGTGTPCIAGEAQEIRLSR